MGIADGMYEAMINEWLATIPKPVPLRIIGLQMTAWVFSSSRMICLSETTAFLSARTSRKSTSSALRVCTSAQV